MISVKKAFFSGSLIVAGLVLYAQPAKPGINQSDAKGKQGWWQRNDVHGNKQYEGRFVDDKPTGAFNYFYETGGKLKAIMNFSDNGKVSRAKLYFPNGKLMGEGKYIDQKRDSLWKFYNEEETLIGEESYTMGKKNGAFKGFYPKGKLLEEKNFKNDIQVGDWKQYFEDGSVKASGNYKDGFLDGKVSYYYPDGKVCAEGNYQHAVKHGTWTYYKPDGTVESIEKYWLGVLKEGTPKLITPQEQEKSKNNPRFKELEEEYQRQIQENGGHQGGE